MDELRTMLQSAGTGLPGRVGSTHSSPGLGGRKGTRLSRSPSPRLRHSRSMGDLDGDRERSIVYVPPSLALTPAAKRDDARRSEDLGGGQGGRSAGARKSTEVVGFDIVRQRALDSRGHNNVSNPPNLRSGGAEGEVDASRGLEGTVRMLTGQLISLGERLTQSETGLAVQVMGEGNEDVACGESGEDVMREEGGGVYLYLLFADVRYWPSGCGPYHADPEPDSILLNPADLNPKPP